MRQAGPPRPDAAQARHSTAKARSHRLLYIVPVLVALIALGGELFIKPSAAHAGGADSLNASSRSRTSGNSRTITPDDNAKSAFKFLATDANANGALTPTSTIDWCELNYIYSYWIAEMVNTLTNLPVIVSGLWCAYQTIAAGVPERYSLVYFGLALIGIGSFGFHASLQWSWQLMDELPMIYVVSYAAYLVIDTLPGLKHRFGIWGPLTMILWDVFVTVSYVSLPNPVYHQVAFAGIMTFAVGRAAWLTYRLPTGYRGKITRTLVRGIAVFVGGFAIWNLDNVFCEYLRGFRAWLSDNGLGHLGHFTEGHGYWHLMTGYGSLLIFTACIELTLATKTAPGEWVFRESDWIPIVRPKGALESSTKVNQKVEKASGKMRSE